MYHKILLLILIKIILHEECFWSTSATSQQAYDILEGVKTNEELRRHAEQFENPRIIKVNEAVYMGFAYGLANSIYILAPQGLIIVDTMESAANADIAFQEFLKIVPDQKTVKAVIYTHFHGDHNEGTRAYITDPDNPPEIWAHKNFIQELDEHAMIGPILFHRGIKQFGFLLPQEEPWYLSNGIGPSGATFFRNSDREVVTSGIIMPTSIVHSDVMEVNIAGLPLTFYNIPGETTDQLGVWIPSHKTFMCGDNLYRAFPTIYTIRGTMDRDPLKWIQSLDTILDLKPDYLIPSHTEPILGRQNVCEILTKYRDGIQYVHDQTLRHINHGYSRDEVAKMINLPYKQRQFDYLKPHYGTVEWSSKAVYNKYFGWFNDRPEQLSPLPPEEESKRIAKLAGGVRILINRAQKMLDAADYQWALELSTHAMRATASTSSKQDAIFVRRAALKGLSEKETSPNGRYYYLSTILEDARLIEPPSTNFTRFATHMPIKQLLRFLSFWFKAEIPQCSLLNTVLLFTFVDASDKYTIHIRNGIVETLEEESKLHVDNDQHNFMCTSSMWRNYISQQVTTQHFLKECCRKNCVKSELEFIFSCFEFYS